MRTKNVKIINAIESKKQSNEKVCNIVKAL